MKPPTTGAPLQKFLFAMQWSKIGIPNFTEFIAPLQKFMEQIYTQTGKRTKRAVASISLSSLNWIDLHQSPSEKCKTALAQQVILAHRDPDKRLCIYTDASGTVWSGAVTQIPQRDLVKPH